MTGCTEMGINNISGLSDSILLSELLKTNTDLLNTFERLATGRKINSASDDAAGLAVATRLESQARALAAAERNAQMGISLAQTAEGYMQSVTSDIQRINELSVQAANGTLDDADRQAIQAEIDQLTENIDFTLSSAEFNTQPLFQGNTFDFMAGSGESGTVSLEIPQINSSTLQLDTIDVTTQSGAQNAISASSFSLDDVLSVRTDIGATVNRLESSLNSLSQTRIDTLSSLSGIMDANIVEEILNASRQTTLLESQLLVAGQINKLQGGLIRLLLD